MPPTIRKESIITGLRIFVILTIAGLILVFYRAGSQETIESLAHFQLWYFALAASLIAVDFVAGAARIFIFVRKITPISEARAFAAAFRANLANTFLACATPFQTGGGLAQIYMLHRAGIPVSDALSVSIMNLIATLSVLLVSGLVVMRWLAARFNESHFRLILDVSSWVFYLVTLLVVVFVFRPVLISRAVRWLLTLLGRLWKRKAQSLGRLADRFCDFVHDYHKQIVYFWRNEKLVLIQNLLITVGLFFNKCLLAYVVLRGMVLEPGFVDVVAIQILLIFFIYFAPTPGASFVAETSAAALMSLLIAEHLVPVYSVLWRFFTTYVGVMIGGIILMRAFGSAAPSPEGDREQAEPA